MAARAPIRRLAASQVRPVTEWATNTTEVATWLPAGEWSSWDAAERFASSGDARLTARNVSLAETPLFVRRRVADAARAMGGAPRLLSRWLPGAV